MLDITCTSNLHFSQSCHLRNGGGRGACFCFLLESSPSWDQPKKKKVRMLVALLLPMLLPQTGLLSPPVMYIYINADFQLPVSEDQLQERVLLWTSVKFTISLIVINQIRKLKKTLLRLPNKNSKSSFHRKHSVYLLSSCMRETTILSHTPFCTRLYYLHIATRAMHKCST